MAKTTIPAGYIAANAVTSTEIAANSVTAAAIASGALVVADIADNAITGAKIAANAVGSSELASGALSGQNFTGDVTFDTDVLFVDSVNNRVGIGTTSPSVALQVHDSLGTTLEDGVLRLIDDTSYAQNVGAAITLGFKYNSSGNALQRGGVIKAIKENATDGNYASALLFGTTANGASTTERMRIDSSGNVGIGTSTTNGLLTLKNTNPPSSLLSIQNYASTTEIGNIKLDQATDILSINTSNITGGIAFGTGASGTEAMRIDSSGNVGINNTSPASFYSGADNLVIGSTSENYNGLTIATSNIGTGRIFFADPDSTTVGQIEYLHTANVMLFATAAEESMRIDSSGNLLHSCTGTSGSAISDGGILLRSDSTNYMQISSGSTGASDLILFYKKSGTGIAGVGGISTFDGEVHFGRNTAGIMPIGSGTAPRVVPTSFSSGTLADGTVTLGDGSARWKDFYMAGDMNVGSQTSNIVPANRKAWFQGGGSYFTSYSAGQSTITTDASGLIVGTPSTRDGNANRYMAGISFDHLLNYSTTGNVTYNTYPHAWIGLKTYDFPGHERSSLVLATRNDVSGSGPTAEQLVISPYGEITMPNQPSARFYCSSGASVTSETVINSANTGATEYFDRNGDYNASTGEFSCPVNGVYLAYAYSNFTGSTNPGYLLLQYYNGSSWVNYAISYKSDTGSWNSVTLFTTIEANAGIMLRFVYNGDPDAGFHWFYGGWHLLA